MCTCSICILRVHVYCFTHTQLNTLNTHTQCIMLAGVHVVKMLKLNAYLVSSAGPHHYLMKGRGQLPGMRCRLSQAWVLSLDFCAVRNGAVLWARHSAAPWLQLRDPLPSWYSVVHGVWAVQVAWRGQQAMPWGGDLGRWTVWVEGKGHLGVWQPLGVCTGVGTPCSYLLRPSRGLGERRQEQG